MHWANKLSSSRSDGNEPVWLGSDAERIRAAWGSGAVMWAAEVGESLIAESASLELTLFNGSGSIVDALRRATTSTTMRVLAIVSGCGEPDMPVVSTEAAEATRDLARRGMEVSDFTRCIRFGHSVLASAFFDAVTDAGPQPDENGELRRVSALVFKLIDEFLVETTPIFLEERSAWGASKSAAQVELVKKILQGDPVDTTHAERVFNYPLSGAHLAVIAWSANPGDHTAHGLRATIDPVLESWGTPRSSLVVPVGSNALWAWGTFAPKGYNERVTTLPQFDGTHLAVGQIGVGLDGFRRTHLEARAVERLIRHGSRQPPPTMAHHDVDLDVLLLADPEAARCFVARHLGPLGADDPRMAELRATLRLYLDMDRSLAKVSAAEHISRNTVTYRVQQAFALCAHDNDTPTTKIRAALTIAQSLLGTPAPAH